ncbi:MAG: FHA domain-containing protein [Candidatus Lindowbacteria bacterium]|nr:FHA domain-containing protein [Candidatus Lindowbacteria bacterium]
MGETWSLRITDPKGRATVHTVEDFPVVIGRDESLPIHSIDKQASRKHCKIEMDEDGTLRLSDLKSTNGTYLNGKKINRARIEDRDRIKIGESIIEVQKQDDVSISEDTGAKRLSILKSFSAGKGSGGGGGGREIEDESSRSAILSKLGGGTEGASTSEYRRNALLADIAMVLARESDQAKIYSTILTGLIKVFPIQRTVILFRKKDTGALNSVATKTAEGVTGSLIVSRTICQHVIKTDEVIVTEDAIADPRFASGDSIIEHNIGAVIAAPIIAREKNMGIFYGSTTERAIGFTDDDLAYLAMIGNLIGLAMLIEASSG